MAIAVKRGFGGGGKKPQYAGRKLVNSVQGNDNYTTNVMAIENLPINKTYNISFTGNYNVSAGGIGARLIDGNGNILDTKTKTFSASEGVTHSFDFTVYTQTPTIYVRMWSQTSVAVQSMVPVRGLAE